MLIKRKKNALNAIYTMHSIDGAAFSLVGVFIPIYLLTLGYSVTAVMVYYIIQNSALMLSSFAAGYLGNRLSIVNLFIFRLPFLFIFLFLLLYLQDNHFPIYALAVIDGWQSALYWIPLHVVFTKSAHRKKMGFALGGLFAWPKIVTIFTPMAGGIVAAFFGFKVLFIITLAIFSVSMVPLMKIRKYNIDFKFKFKNGLKLYKKNKKYLWAEIFNNIGEEVDGIIWPIFIFLSVYKITAVGYVATLISLSAFFLDLYMGKITDKASKKTLIRIGAMLIMAVWMLRYFFISELAFYILAIISGLVFIIFKVPYYAKLFSIPTKSKVDEFFIFREIPVNLARIIVFSLAIIFVNNLTILFPIAGLVYLYFLFI